MIKTEEEEVETTAQEREVTEVIEEKEVVGGTMAMRSEEITGKYGNTLRF